MASPEASSDESSVRFVKEVLADQDPSETTSRRTGFDPSFFQSRQGRSLRQVAVATRRLTDEVDVTNEEDEVGEAVDETHEGGEGDEGDEGGDVDDEMYLEEEEGEGNLSLVGNLMRGGTIFE
ncbi:UNVERIFIED_CONTAM: hypothetical protein Slati_2703100 [Sesamum latifolium]|uniref:Uncharacterized protein n=1 Tax=Sesamum latifolium TaxID=2727402 RepID=A0AAW2VXA9_9LAMI